MIQIHQFRVKDHHHGSLPIPGVVHLIALQIIKIPFFHRKAGSFTISANGIGRFLKGLKLLVDIVPRHSDDNLESGDNQSLEHRRE